MTRIKQIVRFMGLLVLGIVLGEVGLVLCRIVAPPVYASGLVQSAYNLVQQAGSPLTRRTTLNCSTGMSCSDSGGVTVMTAIGSGGSVTNVATGCFLSGGPITTTGTIIASYGNRTVAGTTDTILTGDCGKVVEYSNTAAVAITLPQSGSAGFPAGWFTALTCLSTAASGCTVTPTTSTINGQTAISLRSTQGVTLIADAGGNYAALIANTLPIPGVTNISNRGIIASIPGCGTSLTGFIYFGTDNNTANQCNGTNYQAFNFETANQQIRSFGAGFDGGGTALTSGKTVYTTVPFGCTISAWNIAVDTGTATVDIWKIATGTAIPTIANTITAAALPAISTGTAIHSTTLSGWTTTVTANDIVGFNLNAVSSATEINIIVQCNATS